MGGGGKSEHANVSHNKATTVLGYALTLDDLENWNQVVLNWATKLSHQERSGLVLAALKSLDEDIACKIAILFLFGYYACSANGVTVTISETAKPVG